jgi:predicted permease
MPRFLSSLVRRPAFVVGMVSTLALVIGASTAIFSTLYGVVLRPLPYRDPGRLVAISESDRATGSTDLEVTEGVFPILAKGTRSFESVAAWLPIRQGGFFTTRLWGTDQTVIEQLCTSQLFPTLGVAPLIGRTFSADEDVWTKDRMDVVVLSHSFWRAHYGGDAGVLGKVLSIDVYGFKRDATIVGVMPEGFAFSYPLSAAAPDLWINLQVSPGFSSGHNFNVIARLRPGVTLAQSRAELTTMGNAIRVEHSRDYKDVALHVLPLQAELVRGVTTLIWALGAALGAILLAGCTNIACLLLVRAGARRKELAVRAALGAGRLALLRQTLSETLTLAAVGGALGSILAQVGLHVLVAVLPASLYIPRLDSVPVERGVIALAAGAAALTAIFFGALPAFRLFKPTLVLDLKASETAQGRGGSGRLERLAGLLLVGEVAVALMLVAGTMLLTQSVRRFVQANELFQPEHLVSVDVAFSNAYVHQTPDFDARYPVLYAQFRDRVLAMLGVRSVTFVDHWPLEALRDNSSDFAEAGHASTGTRWPDQAEMHLVDPGYLDVAHAVLARGRWFADSDRPTTAPVAVINTAMARKYFGNREPIGVRIEPSLRFTDERVLYTIVGVIDEPKRFGSGLSADPAVFLDMPQFPTQDRSVVVRTAGTPSTLIEPLRRAALAIVPGAMSVARLQTGEDVTAASTGRARFADALLTTFSSLALVLALVGIYAVVSYETSRRRREIGIRMALGATPRRVKRLVARGVGSRVATGIAFGIAAAYAFGRTLSSLLYGVSPSDPGSLLTAALAVAAVAFLACYLPARRAAAIDPVRTLRLE